MSDQSESGVETRYCPSCGKGVRGRAEQFAQKITCPKCKENVRFFDYPKEPPRSYIPNTGRDRNTVLMLRATVVVAAVAATFALIFLLVAQNFTGTVFSFFVLTIGMLLIAFAVDRHSRLEDAKHELRNLEELKVCLLDAVQKWRGFELNFKQLAQLEAEHSEKLRQDQLAEYHQMRQELTNGIATRESDIQQQLSEISERHDAVQTVAEKYLKELVQWAHKNLTSANFATTKQRIEKAVEFCRKKGAIVTTQAEAGVYKDLKEAFEDVVRKEAARAEQQRIKEQIREEEKARAEIERELRRLENEKAAIEAAIANALERTKDAHSFEVEDLKRRLLEAEAKSHRAISLAQQTRSGFVYIISNIGSFGEGVFKIGMTRRLDPQDRVRELGDASVPFGFDVHMMISCDDAPKLENALHRCLHLQRINKVNHRKEFFRATIDEIREIVEQNHGCVEYVADPEALEYFESERLKGPDLEFVEAVLDKYEEE